MAPPSGPPPVSRRRFLAAGAMAGLGLAGLGDLTSREVRIERQDLKLPRWDANGFKVALLADLHLRDEEAVVRARHTTELAIAEKPDLIVNVGDFLSIFSPTHQRFLKEALEPLHDAKCPSYAILGNHDWGTGVPFQVAEAVNRSPMKILVDAIVEVNGVTLAGMNDCLLARPDWSIMASRPTSRSYISLIHEPDWADRNPTNVSLQLSGHSHGGQVCLPGSIPIHTPSGARRYIAGYYPDAEVPVYVSRGIGTSGPKWRLFCPPELTILTLSGT